MCHGAGDDSKNQEVSGIVTRKLSSADKGAVLAAVCMGEHK